MTEFNELLEKSGIIDFSYQKLKQNDKFNIFTILRNRDDEVKLHSRFIFELLNPKGSHNKQNEFLNLWLETLEITDFIIDDILVRREYNNIDILITNKNNQAIIIENKIWAEDQNQQLERYYKHIIKLGFSDIKIFYLAPNEKEPSSQSIGKVPLDRIFSISYSFHVSTWIKKSAAICAFNPNIRETLNQYQKIIFEMTGNSDNNKEQEEYFQLIGVGDNAFKAHRIIQNWVHVKWFTEWSFWHDLEKQITGTYKILEIEKFSEKTLNSSIHGSRKRNVHYGLTFIFTTSEGFDFGIRLRRNGFGTNYLMIVVVIIKDGKIREIKEDTKYSDFAKRLRYLSEANADFNWLVKKTTDINFEDFNNNRTLGLVNHESRMKIVTECWLEIKELIDNVKIALKSNIDIENIEGE